MVALICAWQQSPKAWGVFACRIQVATIDGPVVYNTYYVDQLAIFHNN